jgi:hypothetical protein
MVAALDAATILSAAGVALLMSGKAGKMASSNRIVTAYGGAGLPSNTQYLVAPVGSDAANRIGR